MRHLPFVVVLGAMLLAASPALAYQPSPTPRPLPINGVTVDIQRRNPHGNSFRGSTHVERPPFIFHEHQHGRAAGHPRFRPTPTPTPRPWHR